MNMFINAIIISIIFCIVKFIEMRFISRENYPLKILVKESLFVFFSVIVGHSILEQIEPLQLLETDTIPKIPEVFTTNPDF